MKKTDKRQSFWESIGKPITDKESALAKMGLDWEPQVVPIKYEIGGVNRVEKDFRLLVNNRTGQTLSPCSNGWKPLGNKEFYGIVKKALEAVGSRAARGGYSHGARTRLQLGDRCVYFISDEIPELGFALYNDDVEEKHSSRLIFYNHHTPGCAMGVRAVVIRKICSNGLIKTGVRTGLTAVHTTAGVDTYRQATKIVEQYREIIKRQQSISEQLARIKISPDEATEHFVNFMGGAKKQIRTTSHQVCLLQSIYDGSASDVLEDQGVDLGLNDYTNGTAYGVLQAATAYNSHFTVSQTLDSAIKRQIFNKGTSSIDAMTNSLAIAYLPSREREKLARTQTVSVGGF